jgi:hypothetical protein
MFRPSVSSTRPGDYAAAKAAPLHHIRCSASWWEPTRHGRLAEPWFLVSLTEVGAVATHTQRKEIQMSNEATETPPLTEDRVRQLERVEMEAQICRQYPCSTEFYKAQVELAQQRIRHSRNW